jgi:hypothetical protein
MLAVAALIPAAAQADYVYQFQFGSGAIGATEYTQPWAVGDTLAVKVYVHQTGADDALTTVGLNTAAVKLTFGPGAAHVVSANPTYNTAGFSSTMRSRTLDAAAGFAALSESTPLPVDGEETWADVPMPKGSSVLVGTFTLKKLLNNEVTTLVASPWDEGSTNSPFGAGGPGELTVLPATARLGTVPEPSSLVGIGSAVLAAAMIGWTRFRRLRAA